MGERGLPPSQLWLPWQRTAAAAAGGSEEGGGELGTGGREEEAGRPLPGRRQGAGLPGAPHPRPTSPGAPPTQRAESKGGKTDPGTLGEADLGEAG